MCIESRERLALADRELQQMARLFEVGFKEVSWTEVIARIIRPVRYSI